ncbi:hypothetical protein [Arthrobacter sp. G119Y2]|uniref:hypothetical protein n=1 Tax=Arthrobacter sp. G119Y2 TaxID=3134965 RepID=UPI003119BB3A
MSTFKHATGMFHSPQRHYWRNTEDAKGTYARPATMDTPEGMQPAVAVFNDKFIRGVYSLDEALRIATQMADSIAYHKQKEAS